MFGTHIIDVYSGIEHYHLVFDRNITIINDDSGTGKTTLYEIVLEYNRLKRNNYNEDSITRNDYIKEAAMKNEIYNVEGIEIEVEHIDKNDANRERRLVAYQFKAIREQAGMNRKDFSDWLGIPYRTMQEWELGRRQAPDYVLRLIAYKVKMEKERGNL